MSSITHPPWCTRNETDGIHRSTPLHTELPELKLTQVAVHLWQLDETPPLHGVGLTFTLGAEEDTHLIDLEQASHLQAALATVIRLHDAADNR